MTFSLTNDIALDNPGTPGDTYAVRIVTRTGGVASVLALGGTPCTGVSRVAG